MTCLMFFNTNYGVGRVRFPLDVDDICVIRTDSVKFFKGERAKYNMPELGHPGKIVLSHVTELLHRVFYFRQFRLCNVAHKYCS